MFISEGGIAFFSKKLVSPVLYDKAVGAVVN